MQFDEQSRVTSRPSGQAHFLDLAPVGSFSKVQVGEVEEEFRTSEEFWDEFAHIASAVMARGFPGTLNISRVVNKYM